ncbi:hypothetical protein [Sporosarcina sp. HYO08]|uniref:hypothetical protein n=1 Tax=Sporosarcina sp. HYO08 TaxID=1759557 RepID=UPI00079B90EC|nr:hypothetical protein [Sporosarcina sp. HYO08]KXH86967.1 hypothetical protein AU377_13565 [Sporosarcina sp. HYO08]
MDTDHPTSWEDIDALVESMLRLYRKDSFQSLLRLSNEAVKMGDNADSIPLVEPFIIKDQSPLEQAFAAYVNEQRLSPGYYNNHPSIPSFVEQEWTELPSAYKVTEKYWLGYPLIAWFERQNLKVRLIVEVGPLPYIGRTRLLKSLEEQGIPVRALAYEEGRSFTRIYSQAVSVENMEDAGELKTAMDQLVSDQKYRSAREGMARAIAALRQTTYTLSDMD